MAKDYLCKDCEHNNNGWCKKHSKQGLKNITECEDKVQKGATLKEITKKALENDAEWKPATKEIEEIDTMPYKVFGKVEMLNTTMMQVIGMENQGKTSISISELKSLLVNLADMISIEEQIHGVKTDCMIDGDILRNKHALTEKWRKEIKK